jgi:hemoglobin-like flavoprotein
MDVGEGVVKPHHTHLIRKSFARIESHGSIAALIFYRRLFELDPDLRPLFRNDIEIQAVKLTAMLGALIGLLERGGALESELKAMGARHAGYGVEDTHYATVGKALLGMLEEVLAGECTPAVREAWALLYAKVESLMKLGASEAGTPAPAPAPAPA